LRPNWPSTGQQVQTGQLREEELQLQVAAGRRLVSELAKSRTAATDWAAARRSRTPAPISGRSETCVRTGRVPDSSYRVGSCDEKQNSSPKQQPVADLCPNWPSTRQQLEIGQLRGEAELQPQVVAGRRIVSELAKYRTAATDWAAARRSRTPAPSSSRSQTCVRTGRVPDSSYRVGSCDEKQNSSPK
jgi:hypothetical protein